MDERFLRNEMLWGPEAQMRLAQTHVIVFGLGGVGSYAAECLARAGIGELTLVDSDTVALSNLNRQLEADFYCRTAQSRGGGKAHCGYQSQRCAAPLAGTV